MLHHSTDVCVSSEAMALGLELLALLVAPDATSAREGGDVVRSNTLEAHKDPRSAGEILANLLKA